MVHAAADPDQSQYVVDFFAQRSMHTCDVPRYFHVTEGGQARPEVVFLKDKTDRSLASLRPIAVRHLEQIFSVDHHDSRSGRHQAPESVNERGLARAGRPNHADEFTAPNV